MFGRNNKPPQRKRTTGFSELNRRTYEASQRPNRSDHSNVSSSYRSQKDVMNQFVPQNIGKNYMSVPPRSSANQVRNSQPKSNVNRSQNGQDVNNYSRRSANSKYHGKVTKAKRNKRIKIVSIVLASILAVIIAAGIAFAFIFGGMNAGMDNIGLTPSDYTKEPFYMVLMGVDSSSERQADGEGSSDSDFRSDSIILARVDCPNKTVSLISLHRDTKVDMGEYGTQKLNAAHSLGGPELVVKCVSELAGVPISHYAEINFDGFQAVVDKLGGVEVNVPMTINDKYAGYVPAGQQTLNGDQALALCRSRHAYDDYGDGDKYRAANQRLVLSAIAKKILSSDIATIADTITTLVQYIKTDFKLNDIIGVAQYMKDLDFNNVWTAMEPTESKYENGVWYEILNQTKWKAMIERMNAGKSPAEETIVDSETGTVLQFAGNSGNEEENIIYSSITVSVKNGTSRSGVAAKASAAISELGFKTDAGNANSSDFKTTVIVYTKDNQESAANAIKDKLGCGKVQKNNNNEYSYTTDILVVIGTDYS